MPELFERPLAAINRVRAWRRGRGDSAQGAVVLAFFRMTLIIATAGRIGAHHQQVVGGRNALVARARRLHNHIARLQHQIAAAGAAETRLDPSTRDPQHFMRRGMIVQEIINPVPPPVAPAMAVEQHLENGGGIEGLIQTDRSAILDQRPTRMVRGHTIIVEDIGIGFALPHQRLCLVRGRPGNAGQPFGLAPDVFQQHDRRTSHRGCGSARSNPFSAVYCQTMGPILTASGLIFIGGTDDARFRAFDSKTGKLLWTYKLDYSATDTPITY